MKISFFLENETLKDCIERGSKKELFVNALEHLYNEALKNPELEQKNILNYIQANLKIRKHETHSHNDDEDYITKISNLTLIYNKSVIIRYAIEKYKNK